MSTAATFVTDLPAQLVLAPQTLIRIRQGRLHIHTSVLEKSQFNTDHPTLIAWIANFYVPRNTIDVLGQLAPAERIHAEQILRHLAACGILQPPTQTGDTAQTPLHEAMQPATQLLSALLQSTFELSGDLHGLGPRAAARLSGTGIGLNERIESLLAGVDALRVELAQERQQCIGEQLAQLGIDAASRNLKLHIGCGKTHLAGWVNIDIYPAPLAMNLKWGLPLPDGSARCVFFAHMLEHLFYPQEVMPVLENIRRVLAPGGVLRVVVPDVEKCIQAYVANDRDFFDSRRKTWTWWQENATRLEDFLAYAGAGPNPAYLFENHKFGYDFETLAAALTRAGFVDVMRSEFQQSAHADLRVDDSSHAGRARFGDRYYSLFVEAIAPPPAAAAQSLRPARAS
ncbi:MAG TPA: methyltransferase domain-containing protein [Xanthomonadaceae bacterium]|nr:methyltransferase domain-containing protein [Xanthomonadaceae bacterium]